VLQAPRREPYTGNVYAQLLNTGWWQNTAMIQSANGCSDWTLPSGFTWRFQALAQAGGLVFQGVSPWAVTYPFGHYDFGPVLVQEYLA